MDVNNLCYICLRTCAKDAPTPELSNIYAEITSVQIPEDLSICYLCRHHLIQLYKFRKLCIESNLRLTLGCDTFDVHRERCSGYNISRSKILEFSVCLECDEHDIDTNESTLTEHNEINNVRSEEANINENIDELPNHLDYESDGENVDNGNDEVVITKEELPQTNYEEIDLVENEIVTGDSDLFEKITLTLEQQKAALEAMRRDARYAKAEFKCYSCALGFVHKDSYQAHMVRHEESNGEYSCEVCGLRFARSNVRAMHRATHAERFRCRRCGAGVRRAGRRGHAARCGAEPARCHRCDAVFPDVICLQQHTRRMHSEQNRKQYRCNICSRSYKSSSTLRVHVLKHNGERHRCTRCPASFSTRSALRRHEHAPPPRARYCAPCDAWFRSQKTYRAHVRTSAAHATETYACSVCGRACPTRASLAEHARTHAPAQHACASCPARYHTRKSLLSHVRRHARAGGGPAALCHLCGKSYKGKNKLRRHLKEVCEPKLPPQDAGA